MVIGFSCGPAKATEPHRKGVGIRGVAGGTGPRQYTAAFGEQVQVTGVEIDPAILDVAYRYFHLASPNVHPVVADARYWLDTQAGKYDVMALDAYQQPYIPFHLTTPQVFTSGPDPLNPGGAVVVNVGRTTTDYRLVEAIASTMEAVYPSVFLVDVPSFTNTMVYGSTQPITIADVEHNLCLVSDALAGAVSNSPPTAE